ncbi:hypothetical protein EB796_007186 [Bugula neritina]|uniref:Disintegrin domain-containing protein n=1 Tax=Bugula neritina TaxID=10212 RepID=A0A7J7K979_BUGNE|nr:hypothetical protein EB796_007186 [Bugula neritina]
MSHELGHALGLTHTDGFVGDRCKCKGPVNSTLSTCIMHSSLNSEECDCGPEEDCNSKCCNPNTCRLYSNATCATGSCCDLETCTVRPISYPCRSVQDSQCDLPETCDGNSEWCPVDTYKRDGTECTNVEQGYCYGGKCNTHSSQCQFLWEGEKANDLCYTFFNNRCKRFSRLVTLLTMD